MSDKAIKRTIIALVFIMIVSSLFSTTVFAKTYYESENNDNISKANSIEVNSTVQGQLDEYDEDYFRFTIPSDGYINLQIDKDYSAYVDYDLIDYDGSTRSNIINDYIGSGSERRLTGNIGVDAGTYYVEISRGNGSEIYNYSFTVSFTSSNNWEGLDNDNVTTAKAISIGQTYYGSLIAGGNDCDYY